MANLCTNIGVVLACLSVVGIIYTLASKEWKKNSQVSSQPNAIGTNSYEGLWVRCYSPVPGTIQCDNYDDSILGLEAELQGMRAMMCLSSIFGAIAMVCSAMVLPCTNVKDRLKRQISRVGGVLLVLAGELQGQRAMMVIATIAAVFGVVTAMLGLECVNAMQGTSAKVWTGRTGGILMILAGVLTIGSVSWYASGVIYEFSIQVATGANYVYELGPALYIGWISGGCALIAGGLLLCCSCGGSEDHEDSYRYAYKPPQAAKSNARSAEYV